MKPDTALSPDALFQAVAAHHGGVGNAPRRGFGSDALKVDGKIFATLSKGRLLLKLPGERVEALIAANIGARFSTGAGRAKKEWVTIAPTNPAHWVRLSDEARAYVVSRAG